MEEMLFKISEMLIFHQISSTCAFLNYRIIDVSDKTPIGYEERSLQSDCSANEYLGPAVLLLSEGVLTNNNECDSQQLTMTRDQYRILRLTHEERVPRINEVYRIYWMQE